MILMRNTSTYKGWAENEASRNVIKSIEETNVDESRGTQASRHSCEGYRLQNLPLGC